MSKEIERRTKPTIDRKRFLIAGALGLAGALGAGGIAALLRKEPVVPGQEAAASGSNPEPSPILAAATSTPKPTIAPAATETAVPKLSPTIEPSPSPAPTKEEEEVIITPTVTFAAPTIAVTPTETPKPVEKSPLPEYGVFMGKMVNKVTGAQGLLMLASLPQKEGEEIAVFWLEQDGKRFPIGAYPLVPKFIQDNTFKAVSKDNLPRWRENTFRVEGNFDPSNQTIEGEFITTTNPGGKEKIVTRSFAVKFVGTGKEKAIEAAKKTKATVRGDGDWTKIRIDEFDREITLP